jgi:hypothetical protein
MARIGVGYAQSQREAKSYSSALSSAQGYGAGARVVPQGGTIGGVSYKVVPPTGGRSTGGGFNYTSLLADFQKREAGARAANIAREQEIRRTYGEIIGQGQGAARTAGLAEIERGKTQAIGAGTQQMISSGLYGTTTAASIPVQAEGQASLSRLKLEDMLQQRTNVAKLGLAGFVERIETPYPDYNMLLQASIAQGSR